MRTFVLAGACVAATAVSAQEVDTTRVNLGEAQVVTNRATRKTPIAFSNLNRAALAQVNKGQDIPFLLSTLPGVVATSDAGNGVGYTALRVRGTDATRINVTANGIPLNDAESHGLFWVNMGDFASSLNDLQVQRGVGTSTNGAGAFGASINMGTERPALLPATEVNVGYGSFNTTKNTLKFHSGLLNNHWAFDARLSYIASDGYRDRATTQLGSYFTQGTYFNGGTMLQLLAFGGKEKTYHAWDGISRDDLKHRRTYNPNGEIKEGKKVVGFYDNQTDVYFQQHAQALLTQRLAPRWNLSAALHYTYGTGYYEEYKNQRKLKDYKLPTFLLNGIEQKKSDLIRRKALENHFFGAIASLNYKEAAWDITAGMGFNHYEGDHYGRVLWVKNYLGNLRPKHEYYRNTGTKTDGNAYVRANFIPVESLNLFADMQYRFIGYKIEGTSDKKAVHDTNENFHFFNPKFGATWNVTTDHQLYASVGVAHREPTRNNYEESFSNHAPRAERLTDFEVGYRYTGAKWEANVGGYYMLYRDQFVANGRYNEIGEAIVENVKDSYRAGIELSGAWKPVQWFRWEANLALSTNRIKDYTAYLYDEDYGEHERKVGNTTIALSPGAAFNNRFAFRHRRFEASLTTQYVGRQYLDNLEMKENSLEAYCVSHLNVGYSFPLRGVKEASISATVYNLFNTKYETNGYSQTSIEKATGKLLSDPRFYPMAGTHLMLNLGLKF